MRGASGWRPRGAPERKKTRPSGRGARRKPRAKQKARSFDRAFRLI